MGICVAATVQQFGHHANHLQTLQRSFHRHKQWRTYWRLNYDQCAGILLPEEPGLFFSEGYPDAPAA